MHHLKTSIEVTGAETEYRGAEAMTPFEKLRAERLRNGNYEGYLLMFDGHKRFPAFLDIESSLPDEDYWKCINAVWANIEVSSPHQSEWLRLFKSF